MEEEFGVSAEGLPEWEALRTAEALTVRYLQEAIKGTKISGRTVVEGGTMKSDTVKTTSSGHVMVNFCGRSYNEEKGQGRVCAEVRVKRKE